MTPLLQQSGERIASEDEDAMVEADQTWTGFAGKTWQVHKFGGTSVASAECYRSAAKIVEDQLGIRNDGEAVNIDAPPPKEELNLAVVVSAMGGKPKTTDLLLQSVEAAAKRQPEQADNFLELVREKHATCLEDLFDGTDYKELLAIVETDLENIRDILKTVALMKWQAQRISELVSGYGELWSARILSRVLHNRSVERQSGGELEDEFVFIDARRIIIIDEDAIQNGAVEWTISQQKLKEVYQEESQKHAGQGRLHFVITGYVASNMHGVPTTLQRDGSDYSAAIMGRLLQSTNITIWTDVDGVLSADPRRVPKAYAVPEVSYNEAMELAYFGAKVIHPKTMQPAISSNPQIPIYIRNTFNSSFRGTRIYTSSVTNTQSDSCVCGFSSIDNIALINVEGSGLIGVQGVAKRLFGTLEHLGINVVLISQASSEHSITFATPTDDATRAKEAIEEEFQKELNQNRISKIDVNVPCSIVAAVGDGMKELTGVAGRFFSALGDAQINVFAIAQGCSERNISVVVSASESTRALRALHAAFRLSHTTVRVGIVGMNNPLGESLLRLLEVQRRRLWNSFEIDLQVCTVAMDSHDTEIFQLLKHDGDDSINLGALRAARKPSNESASRISFESQTTVGGDLELVGSSHTDLSQLLDSVVRDDCAHHVIFDCTDDVEASRFHPSWLHKGVHVVTANITGISGAKEISNEILAAEKARGKLSAQYLREVTVCGGLPVISTIRTLLNSGDKIRRVDGIVSVAMSYIMFRISPPPEFSKSGEFDKNCTSGEFHGDIIGGVGMSEACSFSQAVKEAMSMDLMEKDLSSDLRNDYASCVLMVLAKELGVGENLKHEEIRNRSETIVDLPDGAITDPRVFEGSIDEEVSARVKVAHDKGCVLRHVGSVDVKTGLLEIKIAEVPFNHVFATTPPTVECVRFFTHRFQHYPLVVQGPSAGMDCTSSALLAELLSMMRSKVGPKSGILSRSDSSAFLK